MSQIGISKISVPPDGFDSSGTMRIRISLLFVRGSVPDGSPFEGIDHLILLLLPHDYPFQPPAVTFESRIRHNRIVEGIIEFRGTDCATASHIDETLISAHENDMPRFPVKLRWMNGKIIKVDMSLSETIGTLKHRIQLKEGISATRLRLFCRTNGTVLSDDLKTMKQCNVRISTNIDVMIEDSGTAESSLQMTWLPGHSILRIILFVQHLLANPQTTSGFDDFDDTTGMFKSTMTATASGSDSVSTSMQIVPHVKDEYCDVSGISFDDSL